MNIHRLINELDSRNSYEYCAFEKGFAEVLNKHAPKKRKILRVNQKTHVNKHYILELWNALN